MKRLPIMHAVALLADQTGGLAGQLVDESCMKPNAKAGAGAAAAAAGGGHTLTRNAAASAGSIQAPARTHACDAPGRPPSDDQTTRPLHETWAGRSS